MIRVGQFNFQIDMMELDIAFNEGNYTATTSFAIISYSIKAHKFVVWIRKILVRCFCLGKKRLSQQTYIDFFSGKIMKELSNSVNASNRTNIR